LDYKLNGDNQIPLYYQLENVLREKIELGDWMPKDKIPSENELMRWYELSRNTVQRAIHNLVQIGLLKRVQGRGTFVSNPKFEQSLTGFYSFSKVMKEKNMNPKDKVIDIKNKNSPSVVANKLEISENESVIQLRRLRCANDEPIILETSYLSKEYVPHIPQEEIEQTSLYTYLEETYGIIMTSAKEVFEPVLIQDYESGYLGVEEGSPALLLDRIAYNLSGRPVEFCRSIVRGDRCRFYTELI